MTYEGVEVRRTAAGDLIDAKALRGFACAALSLDPVRDEVTGLLFEHLAKGRFDPSVVAGSLRPIIDELLDTTTRADWRFVADHLIDDARQVLEIRERDDRSG